MIFVTVGTNEATFDRLLRGVRGFPDGEELIVQHGPSPLRPPGATCAEFLPFEVLSDHVRRARVVVTHAGVGSIIVCLANGHRPIVVPRRADRGEAVDDHQVPLCERLASAGLVRLVHDPELLAAEVAVPTRATTDSAPQAARLAQDLHDHLAERIGPPAAGVPARGRR